MIIINDQMLLHETHWEKNGRVLRMHFRLVINLLFVFKLRFKHGHGHRASLKPFHRIFKKVTKTNNKFNLEESGISENQSRECDGCGRTSQQSSWITVLVGLSESGRKLCCRIISYQASGRYWQTVFARLRSCWL